MITLDTFMGYHTLTMKCIKVFQQCCAGELGFGFRQEHTYKKKNIHLETPLTLFITNLTVETHA